MADDDSTQTCSIDGCGKPMRARGWCATHWGRWRKHGDPRLGAKSYLGAKCSVEWCDRKPRSRFKGGAEFCAAHYLQMHNNGAIGSKPKEPSPDGRCSIEGCERQARSAVSPHCEMHYYRIRRNGTITPKVVVGIWSECQYCGESTGGRKYCTSACEAGHRRGSPLTRCCEVCGTEFDPRSEHGRDSMVCGDVCHKARELGWSRRFYARSMKTERGRARIRRAEYKRKARKLDAFVEVVERDEVMARGKWRCHLCGDPIPRRAKWPEPLFGTVDHVLPLAEGGKHSYANCKPAHLSCNCRKGARPIGQLGLPLAA